MASTSGRVKRPSRQPPARPVHGSETAPPFRPSSPPAFEVLVRGPRPSRRTPPRPAAALDALRPRRARLGFAAVHRDLAGPPVLSGLRQARRPVRRLRSQRVLLHPARTRGSPPIPPAASEDETGRWWTHGLPQSGTVRRGRREHPHRGGGSDRRAGPRGSRRAAAVGGTRPLNLVGRSRTVLVGE